MIVPDTSQEPEDAGRQTECEPPRASRLPAPLPEPTGSEAPLDLSEAAAEDNDALPEWQIIRRDANGVRSTSPAELTPGHMRALRNAAESAASVRIAEIQKALGNLPGANTAYVEAARKVAQAIPSLDVTAYLPKIVSNPAALDMNRALSERMTKLARAFADAVSPVLNPAIGELVERVQRSLQIDPELLDRLREVTEGEMPENVRGMKVEDLLALVSLAETHRIGVFYAIRTERLRQVLDAADDPDTIDATLNEFADEDLAFVEGVLYKVIEADPRLGGLATLLMEAVAALRCGLLAASQALSTSVWDTEISHAAGKRGKAITYAKGRAFSANQIRREGLLELFESGVHAPLVKAYLAPNDSASY